MVTRPPTPEDIQAFADRMISGELPPPPSAQWLDWTLVEMDLPGRRIVVDFTATQTMLNPAGKVQGGILTAMMDDTMGPLALILYAGRMMPSTLDIHTQFFRPCMAGTLRCEARVTQLGRSLCYTAADLFDPRGRKMASAIQTAMMVPMGDAGADRYAAPDIAKPSAN